MKIVTLVVLKASFILACRVTDTKSRLVYADNVFMFIEVIMFPHSSVYRKGFRPSYPFYGFPEFSAKSSDKLIKTYFCYR